MNKIFGRPLGFLFHKEQKLSSSSSTSGADLPPVPDFIDMLCSYIAIHGQVLGIFRVSGSLRHTEALKQQFEEANNSNYKPIMPGTDPNAIASLLKMYLRELPQPLIEARFYRKLCNLFGANSSSAASEEENESTSGAESSITRERVIELRGIVRSMSERNIVVLERLMALCALIVKNREVTMMNDENVALVLGPNLLWAPSEEEDENGDLKRDDPSAFAMNSLKDTPTICAIVSVLVVNYSQIFENDSPYDIELKGSKNLSRDQLWVKKSATSTTSTQSGALSARGMQHLRAGSMFNSPSTSPSSPSGGVAKKQLLVGLQPKNYSSGSDTEQKRGGASKNFRGHMPRGIVEKLSVGADMIYPLRLVRLTGESLVVMTIRESTTSEGHAQSEFLVDREIPYDHIKKLEIMNQVKTVEKVEDDDEEQPGKKEEKKKTNTDSVNGIKVIYQQKGGFNTSVIVTEDFGSTEQDPSLYHYVDTSISLRMWHDNLSSVLKRYESFVALAKNDPDNFGAVLTKKEFKIAKQAKMEQQKKLEDERKIALDHPVDELMTIEGTVSNNIISINKLSYQQMINTILQLREKLNTEEKTRKMLEFRLQEMDSQNKEYLSEVRSLKTRSIRISDSNKRSSRRLGSRFRPSNSGNVSGYESEYASEEEYEDEYGADSDDSVEFR